jgi:hypothetical protein
MHILKNSNVCATSKIKQSLKDTKCVRYSDITIDPDKKSGDFDEMMSFLNLFGKNLKSNQIRVLENNAKKWCDKWSLDNLYLIYSDAENIKK